MGVVASSGSGPTVMRLRLGVLSGIGLCLVIAIYSLLRYPAILQPLAVGIVYLLLLGATSAIYIVLALRDTHRQSPAAWAILRLAGPWGLAAGGLWVIEVLAANLLDPHQTWVLIAYYGATVLAVVVPIVPGFLGARQSERTGTGATIGAWVGMIGGLVTFLVLMAITYVQVLVPALPYYHNPADYQQFLASKAPDFATYTIGDALAGGTAHLLVIGLLLGSLAGLLGGALGASVGPKSTRS